jgi:inner membrane transporter RhtA
MSAAVRFDPMSGRTLRLPPSLLFVVGAVSMYEGAAIAYELFDELPAQTVAWLRIVGAALVMAGLARPWRVRWTRSELIAASAFGVVTAAMNGAFYLATARVHLGSTVAIEFVGPVAVAAVSARSSRAVLALVLAGGGVACLSIGLRADALGLVWALTAGACWAGYIVLGARVSAQRGGVTGLALALAFGAAALTPFGAGGSGPAWSSPRLLVLCVAVGVLSTAVPYGIDQHVLRRVPRGRFALLLALLPVTATIIGRIDLQQRPEPLELVGIGLVVVGLLAQGPTAVTEQVIEEAP